MACPMLKAMAGFCTLMMRKKSSMTLTATPFGTVASTMIFVTWSRMTIPAESMRGMSRDLISLFFVFRIIANSVGTLGDVCPVT